MNEDTRQGLLRRRRGTVYIMVLAVAVNVLAIGLAATYLVRVRLRQVRSDNGVREVRLLAQSAVEQAVSVITDPTTGGNWRNDFASGEETSPVTLGGGRMSFKLVDDDGDLADDPTDPVWIYGVGRIADAVWVERARARINGGLPLECLRTVVHSRGNLNIAEGFKLTAVGAPASTDRELALGGTIAGDAEAFSRSGIGTVTGAFTVPAQKKGMPDRKLFDDYVARATSLTFSGSFNSIVLGPGINEYDGSGANPDGVYYINTGGSDLQIANMRLCGTLLVDTGQGKLSIDTCLLEPYRGDFPVLIVKGSLYCCFCFPNLAEGYPTSHNFNPPGAPYLGETDGDKSDSYSPAIRGLVHVIGNVELINMGSSTGVFVVDGSVRIGGALTRLTHDPELMFNPPLGYTEDPDSTAMIISGGSWSRQPAP